MILHCYHVGTLVYRLCSLLYFYWFLPMWLVPSHVFLLQRKRVTFIPVLAHGDASYSHASFPCLHAVHGGALRLITDCKMLTHCSLLGLMAELWVYLIIFTLLSLENLIRILPRLLKL